MLPTLVLVDDEMDKRILLERFLKKRFPENPVVSFADCSSAVPMVTSPTPKVVITNGKISTQDGIAFAAYLHNELKVPVVIVSYRSNLEQKARQAGVIAFVDPGDEEGIKEAVVLALSRASEPNAAVSFTDTPCHHRK